MPKALKRTFLFGLNPSTCHRTLRKSELPLASASSRGSCLSSECVESASTPNGRRDPAAFLQRVPP